MAIKEDRWLAGILDKPAFRAEAGDADAVRAHAVGRSAFYFAKVDAADVASTKALLGAGFFVADVNVTFAVPPAKVTAGVAAAGFVPTVEIGTLPAGDLPSDLAKKEALLMVAHDSFRFTRFHLDPLVPKAHADLVKKEWVRNYADGKRGDHLFVAFDAGEPVGFLAALKSHDGTQAIIDLVGVHPKAQRRGVGRTIIAAFAEHYRDVNELVVGTQVANIPSVQLYESMGFRLKASQTVLHMHVKSGVPL